MKRMLCLLVSLTMLVLLGAPAYADSPKPPINSHFGYFTSHSMHGGIAGTASDGSEDWSGYALTGASGSYNSVMSSWTQPKLNCAALNESAYSAYWTGLDGFNDQTVEQIGTEANCFGGQPSYAAWYEMYPSNPYQVFVGLTITPGDHMYSGVNYTPASTKITNSQTITTPASYMLWIIDATTGKYFSTSVSPTQTYARSSAEVIIEAPYSNGTLPLADYGTVNFTNSQVNGSAMGSQASLQDIIMWNPANVWSVPSAFDATNEDFSITWYK